MPGLVPGIHVFGAAKQVVDGRVTLAKTRFALMLGYDDSAHFASARFGGVAGHDLISAS